MNRRGFIAGLAGILAAPTIVRAASIMPVSVPKVAPIIPFAEWAPDGVWKACEFGDYLIVTHVEHRPLIVHRPAINETIAWRAA